MRFRCNCCGTWPHDLLEFESDIPVCPKCGATGARFIAPLIDIHFMVMDHKGPINSANGRQRVACEPGRAHLCLDASIPWSATGEASAVTCPRCKGTKEWRAAAQENDELRMKLAMEAEAKRLMVDLGSNCCG